MIVVRAVVRRIRNARIGGSIATGIDRTLVACVGRAIVTCVVCVVTCVVPTFDRAIAARFATTFDRGVGTRVERSIGTHSSFNACIERSPPISTR
jgi:uncharacterized protein (DUF697 family)